MLSFENFIPSFYFVLFSPLDFFLWESSVLLSGLESMITKVTFCPQMPESGYYYERLTTISKQVTENIPLSISFTVQTEDNPRVAQVSITKCSADMNGYCLHGQCIYLVDMSENYCR